MPDYVKLHTEALDSVKIQTLPDSLVRPWMNLLLVSRLHGGILPDIKTICFRLRTDQTTVAGWLSALERAGLIDRSAGERGEISMHDWEFWNPEDRRDQQNAERQRRFRAKKSAFKKENQTEDNPIQPNVTFVTRNVERNVTVEPLRNVTDGMAEWPSNRARLRPSVHLDGDTGTGLPGRRRFGRRRQTGALRRTTKRAGLQKPRETGCENVD